MRKLTSAYSAAKLAGGATWGPPRCSLAAGGRAMYGGISMDSSTPASPVSFTTFDLSTFAYSPEPQSLQVAWPCCGRVFVACLHVGRLHLLLLPLLLL